MRFLALDTETTGLKSKEGDRIIEVAIVEITRNPNPAFFHCYFNPGEREIAEDATEVHGLTSAFLADKPSFEDMIDEILDFIGDEATLVIHNAPFDIEFLRDECMNSNRIWPEFPVIDTLKEAARQFPGSRHSLDALCNRFKIDLTRRTKHGALIDTQLLAELYLAWFGQGGFDLEARTSVVTAEKIAPLGALNTILVPTPEIAREALPAKSWDAFFDKFPV